MRFLFLADSLSKHEAYGRNVIKGTCAGKIWRHSCPFCRCINWNPGRWDDCPRVTQQDSGGMENGTLVSWFWTILKYVAHKIFQTHTQNYKKLYNDQTCPYNQPKKENIASTVEALLGTSLWSHALPLLLPSPPHSHHHQGVSTILKSVFNPMCLLLQYMLFSAFLTYVCSPISHPVLLPISLKPA